jgi:hypothetical protein
MTCNAFINGQEDQLQAVVVPLVEGLHDVSQNGRVFAAGSPDGDEVSGLEQAGLDDGEVDLGLEGVVEALFAQRVAGFRPLKRCSG